MWSTTLALTVKEFFQGIPDWDLGAIVKLIVAVILFLAILGFGLMMLVGGWDLIKSAFERDKSPSSERVKSDADPKPEPPQAPADNVATPVGRFMTTISPNRRKACECNVSPAHADGHSAAMLLIGAWLLLANVAGPIDRANADPRSSQRLNFTLGHAGDSAQIVEITSPASAGWKAHERWDAVVAAVELERLPSHHAGGVHRTLRDLVRAVW